MGRRALSSRLLAWLLRSWQPGPWWWLTVFVLAGAIFWLSSIPADSLFTPGPPKGVLNAVFKKAAHIGMYGALALAVERALGLRPHTWLWALSSVALYGLSDEWHQSFVAGREATGRDVGFDALGAILGLWLQHRRVLPVAFRSPEPSETSLRR